MMKMKTKQEKQKDKEKASNYLQTRPAAGYFGDTLRSADVSGQYNATLYNYLRIDVDTLNRNTEKEESGAFCLCFFLTGAVF